MGAIDRDDDKTSMRGRRAPVMSDGPAPTRRVMGAANWPEPICKKIETLLSKPLATTMSSRPSPVRSAAATSEQRR